MASWFQQNCEALAARSPVTAAAVEAARADTAFSVRLSASGDPVVERDGRTLDGRRDPAADARRAAQAVTADRVAVAGFGSGYFCEALVERGIQVALIVEPDAGCLAAAMSARDLRPLLGTIPVVLLDALRDRVALATWRATVAQIVPHAASVAAAPALAALVEAWPKVRVARRRPRVLIVGPIYGGSLEVARSASAAFQSAGCDARLFDASVFGDAHHALGSLALPSAARGSMQSAFACLLADAIVAVAGEWKPDLVFSLAQAPLTDAALQCLRTLGIPSAFWFVENSRVLTYWKHVAGHYDWFYAIQPGPFLEQLAAAGAPRPSYLPMACAPERHAPVALTDAERTRFGSDVSFAGSPYLNRRHSLQALADFDLRLWGPGWDDPVLKPHAAEGGQHFTIDEMVKIFCASRINLNLHSANHVSGLDPDPDFVNPRTFELAACNAFQLVDRRDPLPALFTSDEIVTFESVAELRALVGRFLRSDDERMAIAQRSQQRALGEHTYGHRIRQVLNDTLPPELAAAAAVGVTTESLDEALLRLERDSRSLTDDEATLRIVREVHVAWMGR
ncbi:MAG TPA: glycosyltransferase [Vicinamibacterales bacterium]|nr:glycosyltransferase [Vicinamibacterales bacterium]